MLHIAIYLKIHFEESNHQTNYRCFSKSFCFESGYEILHHVFLSRSWMYFLPWSGCTRLHWRGTAWIVDFPHSSEFNAKRSVTSGRRTNDTQILSPCNIIIVTSILQVRRAFACVKLWQHPERQKYVHPFQN